MCVRWTHVYFWKNFARVRRKKVSKPERKLKADKEWLLNIDEKMENVGHTFSRNCALFKSETSFRPRKRLIRAILHTNERFRIVLKQRFISVDWHRYFLDPIYTIDRAPSLASMAKDGRAFFLTMNSRKFISRWFDVSPRASRINCNHRCRWRDRDVRIRRLGIGR